MKRYLFYIYLVLTTTLFGLEAANYGVAKAPWPEKYGNHRGVVEVKTANSVARVTIPWRLKSCPLFKALIVVEAKSEKEVKKIYRWKISALSGEVFFKAEAAGLYYIYYLPYKVDPTWAGFKGYYLPRNPNSLICGREKAKKATLIRLESRTQVDSFYPMEVIPTRAEKAALISKGRGLDYLLFVENRLNQIRMKKEVPYKWTQSGEVTLLKDEAAKNEWYPIQIGLFATYKALSNVECQYNDLISSDGSKIKAQAFSCINIEGVDPWGNDFTKRIDIKMGAVQPLWIGVDIARTQPAGEYRGIITITADNAKPREVEIALTVTDKLLADRGDSELWRLSRLRWLNSKAGLDDSQMIEPFTALERKNQSDQWRFSLLNREVVIGANGLPAQIWVKGKSLLKQPISLGAVIDLVQVDSLEITKQKAYQVAWKWKGSLANGLILKGTGLLEADGYMEFNVGLESSLKQIDGSVSLGIPLNAKFSDYILGFGGDGGVRPQSLNVKWGGLPRDSFWIGNTKAGLYCEMQGASYSGPLLNLYKPEYPEAWYNRGKGRYGLNTNGDRIDAFVSSGKRVLAKGHSINYKFAFLVTPMQDVDWKSHFNERYYHMTPLKEFALFGMNKKSAKPTVLENMLMANSSMPLDADLKYGINVINVHHAHYENPYINYPFTTPKRIKSFVKKAHAKNLKVKLYYTVRELSNAAYEIWALRSLGNEIYTDGRGGGFIWLQEHLESDYTPAWYSHNGEIDAPDAAIVTSGISRWYNYYVEGLKWMVKNYEIDGIYLDDVAFDRTILKRMRRVMQDSKSGCLIDLHSNNGFSKCPAIQYTEFFPYIDRLWFGESFQYDQMTPEQMLVEASGVPFGLTSDMLNRGGNPWRGLIYGMTNRYPWYSERKVSDPRAIYALLDSIGIRDANNFFWWEGNLPVRTGDSDIKTTVYQSNSGDKVLIALASFALMTKKVQLQIDWEQLGLSPDQCKISRPKLPNMQTQEKLSPTSELTIEPKKGAVILIEKR